MFVYGWKMFHSINCTLIQCILFPDCHPGMKHRIAKHQEMAVAALLKAELERLIDQMDDFGQELLLLQAQSIAQMRPAPSNPPSLYLVGSVRHARRRDQADVLHLRQR